MHAPSEHGDARGRAAAALATAAVALLGGGPRALLARTWLGAAAAVLLLGLSALARRERAAAPMRRRAGGALLGCCLVHPLAGLLACAVSLAPAAEVRAGGPTTLPLAAGSLAGAVLALAPSALACASGWRHGPPLWWSGDAWCTLPAALLCCHAVAGKASPPALLRWALPAIVGAAALAELAGAPDAPIALWVGASGFAVAQHVATRRHAHRSP